MLGNSRPANQLACFNLCDGVYIYSKRRQRILRSEAGCFWVCAFWRNLNYTSAHTRQTAHRKVSALLWKSSSLQQQLSQGYFRGEAKDRLCIHITYVMYINIRPHCENLGLNIHIYMYAVQVCYASWYLHSKKLSIFCTADDWVCCIRSWWWNTCLYYINMHQSFWSFFICMSL